jgi:hypothetical protein
MKSKSLRTSILLATMMCNMMTLTASAEEIVTLKKSTTTIVFSSPKLTQSLAPIKKILACPKGKGICESGQNIWCCPVNCDCGTYPGSCSFTCY